MDAHDNKDVRHRGGLELARELVSLLGALSQAGDAINVQVVSERLGIGVEEGARLLELLLSASGGEDEYLSLSSPDDFATLSLAFDNGVRGRPVRLTQGEAQALLAALNRLGVPEDDPLRTHIRQGFLSKEVSQADIERQLAPLESPQLARPLKVLAHAIVDQDAVSFSYQGTLDQAAHPRRVLPQALHQEDGTWYLDAYDLDRHARRTFRLDRMDAPSLAVSSDETTDVAAALHTQPAHPQARQVHLRFYDPHYLDLLEWPGLELHKYNKAYREGTIPYYGSDWLPRHIAACGGSVTTDDRKLASAVDRVTRELLSRI